MTMKPWLSLPYGRHVDALLTAAEQMTFHEWDQVPPIYTPSPVVGHAYAALAADADGRFASTRAAVRRVDINVVGPFWAKRALADVVVVLCAAHLIGRPDLTARAIAATCERLTDAAALAAVLRTALAAVGTITARGVS